MTEPGLVAVFRRELNWHLQWIALNASQQWERRTAPASFMDDQWIDLTESAPKLMEASYRFLVSAAQTLYHIDDCFPDATLRCRFEITDWTRMRLFSHLANDPSIQSLWPPTTRPGHQVHTHVQGHFLSFDRVPRETYRGCMQAVACAATGRTRYSRSSQGRYRLFR